jgi:hypothetical protein
MAAALAFLVATLTRLMALDTWCVIITGKTQLQTAMEPKADLGAASVHGRFTTTRSTGQSRRQERDNGLERAYGMIMCISASNLETVTTLTFQFSGKGRSALIQSGVFQMEQAFGIRMIQRAMEPM